MTLKFTKIESYKRGIVFSSLFNFIAKILIFVQSIAIAYYFGAQAKTDIYLYCLSMILLITVSITSLDSSVIIPESMRLRAQGSEAESMQFLNFFIYLYLLIGVVITAIFYLYPVDIFQALSNFGKETLQENFSILAMTAPIFTLSLITTLLGDILVSYKFFAILMVAAILNGFFALLFIVSLHARLNVISIPLGLIVGYVINISMLVYLMKKHLNWDFKFKFVSIGKKNWNNILFSQAGSMASALSGYAPLFLLSGFGAGIITALNYGQRSSDIINQLLTIQFSSVIAIKFNELYSNKDFPGLNTIFNDSISLLSFVLLPVSALMFIYSEELVSILFKQGALDIKSMIIASNFFRYFSLLLPLLAISAMVSRLLMAGQKVREMFWYQIALNTLLILLVFICVRHFGYLGYPFSLIIIYALNAIFSYFLLKKFFPTIEYRNILWCFITLCLLNLPIFYIIWKLKYLFNNVNMVVNLLAGSAIYFFILILLNLIFKFNKTVNQHIYSNLGLLGKFIKGIAF